MSFDFLLWRFNRHGKLIDIIKIAKSSPFDNHSTSLANQQVKLHHNVKCKQKETNLQNRDLSDSRTVFYAFVSISSENGLLETHTRRHIGHKSSLYLPWGGKVFTNRHEFQCIIWNGLSRIGGISKGGNTSALQT